MNMPANGPLDPGRATTFIRSKVTPSLTVCLTGHAKEQMAERELIMSDVLYVLKRGFVFEPGEPSTQEGFYKYKMESTTPNSNGRTVRVVVIPGGANQVKIVTVMWRDEARVRG